MIARSAYLTILIIMLSLAQSQAQIGGPGFAKHLTSQADYESVIALQNYLNPGLDAAQQDSMNYYTGWAHFHLQHLNPAISSFNAVSPNSSFFEQSRIFSSWCRLYLGDSDGAQADLNRIGGKRPLLIRPIQQAAIHLYNRDYDKASDLLQKSGSSSKRYEAQLNKLNKLLEHGRQYSPKSVGLAALYSALLPGAGKVYAGETVAGVSSFLLAAGLGGMAVENILKTGWSSWNSLLITGLFASLYANNIYESMISVQTYRKRFNENYDTAIMATVIIPLRDYYR